MERILSVSLLALAVAFVAAGCGKDPVSPNTTGGSTEQSQAIDQTLGQTPELADNDTYVAPGESEFSDGYDSYGSTASAKGGFSTEEAIRPVFFFRVIRDHDRDIHIDTERESTYEVAKVLVVDRFAGSFNIVAVDSTDTGVVRRRIQKPLADVGQFRALLKRRLSGDDPAAVAAGPWHLVGVSNREIASPEHSTQIASVRLQSRSGLDVTITDPLELMRFPLGLPRVDAGEWVKVTVVTKDPTDAVFLLAGWGRQRLRHSAEGPFVGAFRAPFELRLFRVGVNALDHGTLFDDQLPYDSDFWGLLARTGVPQVAAQP